MNNLTTLTAALLCFGLLFYLPDRLYGQINQADSLALVDLYNSTDGTNWNNNENWLTTEPVETWFGVVVVAERVNALNLESNNLSGPIPGSFTDMSELQFATLNDNFITDLPFLGFETILELIDVSLNNLEFPDLEDNVSMLAIPNFFYAPQRPYYIPFFFNKQEGESVTFDAPMDGLDNSFTWFKDGDILVNGPGPESQYSITSILEENAGTYTCQVTSGVVPGLTLVSQPQSLTVGPCLDELGGEFICKQMIVTFVPGTTQIEKDDLREELGAERIDSCLCNFLELWELPDSLDLESTITTSKEKTEIEDTGRNYLIRVPPPPVQLDPPGSVPAFIGNPPSPGNVTVAIIDSGVQYDHDFLEMQIWTNGMEVLQDGVDDDGNCITDDYQGYDFVNDTIDVYDLNSHGTHVAGIVLNATPPSIDVMNLKIFETGGGGTIFDAACAVYYASQNGARVMNMSWGYYGEPSSVLKTAIQDAADNCGALVVASAGNLGTDNDLMPHYPSDYKLDNLISVASMNTTNTNLADFSNFGVETVDVAARGEMIMSTVPPNMMDIKSGTSMAAGEVSRLAALMFHQDPAATFRSVKACIFNTVSMIPGGADSLSTGGQIRNNDALNCLTTFPYISECEPILELNVMLEGPYDESGGFPMMQTNITGSLPFSQPYNISPWNYIGSETTNLTVLNGTGANAIVDWVLVAHIVPTPSDTAITYHAGLVTAFGNVISPNGDPFLRLQTSEEGFIAVLHRNHLAIQSQMPIRFDNQPTVVNFSDGTTPVLGPPGVSLLGGGGTTIGMTSGDANRDGTVNAVDKNSFWSLQNGTAYDYFLSTADFNLDGSINAVDKNFYWSLQNGQQSMCVFCY